MDEISKITDYGKLAYQETRNIKRDMLSFASLHLPTICWFNEENVLAQNNAVLEFNFNSEVKNIVNLNVQLTLSDNSTASSFLLKVVINGVMLNCFNITLNKGGMFCQNFNFFANQLNNVKFLIVANQPVLIKHFACTASGEITVLETAEHFLETHNQTGAVTLLYNNNNHYSVLNYANLQDLFNNFTHGSYDQHFYKVYSLSYAFNNSLPYVNNELFALYQQQNDDKLYVGNLQKTKQKVVAQNFMFGAICPLKHAQRAIMVYLYDNFELQFMALDNNLNVKVAGSVQLQNKSNIKKIVAVINKDQFSSNKCDVIIVTTKNQLFLVSVQTNINHTEYIINPHPIFIGNGEDVYAVSNNLQMLCFVPTHAGVTKTMFIYDNDSKTYKRKNSEFIVNAKLGFCNKDLQPFYLYYNNFDVEPQL